MLQRRARRFDVPSKNPVRGFRFSPELMERLQQYAVQQSRDLGGAHVPLARVVVQLLVQALDEEDRKRKQRKR